MEKDSRKPSVKGGLQSRKSSLRRSGAAPTSKTSLGSRVHRDSSDMSRRKKVKFADPVSIRELSGRQDLPSFQSERIHSSSFGNAKTSEYKTFKRLLEETDSKRHSYQLPNHDNNLKTFEASDCMQEKDYSITYRYEVNRSLLPIQKVTPIAQRSSLSPAKISQNFELSNRSKCKHNTSSSLLPIEKVTPVAGRSSLSPVIVSLNCGPKHECGGTFSEKRKNLLRLAAETSSKKVDEILLNKSDLILEFLQRLGTGRKSSNLDELPKLGQKVSDGRYHSLACPKSYGDIEELQETVGTDIPPPVRKNLGRDLLAYRCNEADELINLALDHVEDQAFPIWHAPETGLQCQRWQSNLVSDEKGDSHLHAENKSASTAELGKKFGCRKYGYRTVGQMLSKADELIALPWDYTEVQDFPPLRAFDIRLQGKRWHSNSVVDERIFENKLASTGYHAMDRMLSKSDQLFTLPWDHAEVQAFPTLHARDTGLQGRRWHSDSVLDKEGISENNSASTGYRIMDCMLSKADELITLSKDVEVQAFPASHALQTDLQGKNWHSSSVLGGISGPHSENRSASTVEFSLGFEYGKYGFHTMDHMLSKFGYLIPNNFPSRCHFTEQSIVPYINSTSSELYDLSSPDLNSGLVEEQCTLPLLQWNDSFQPELSIASDGKLPKELDCLPLTLYTAPDILDKTKGFRFIDPYGRRNIFSSPLSSGPFSTPRPGFELEWKSLPIDFNREHCSSTFANLQFEEEQANGRLGCIATGKRYCGCDNEKSLMEIQSHFPDDYSSLDLPARLSWH